MPQEVKDIIKQIEAAGFEAFAVGGCVRDCILGRTPQDWDITTSALPSQIKEIFARTIDTGIQHGTVTVMIGKTGYEITTYRIDGEYKDCRHPENVEFSSDLKDDLKRRDFTINAMMYDYQNEKLIDYYQGQEDIKNKCLKMVDEKTFYEDPLRVLRLAQFMARFEFQVDLKTKEICQKMVNEGVLQYLSLERIQQEYNKLLMSSHPSMGLKFLLELNALIRPLETLATCPQRLDFHPEGNVMNHTLLVVDLAALCKDKTSWPLAFMWSALLHDIGKPLVTTPEGKAPGHNESGVKVFNQYFSHFFTNKKMKKYIRTMIYYHMHLMNMVRNQSKDYSYYKLLKGIEGIFPLNDLVCMSKCDKLGRLANRPETISTLDTYVEEKVSRCGNHALKPFVDGKLLIELGFKPNQDFKELLDWAYDLQMRGHDKESVIQLLKGRKDGK